MTSTRIVNSQLTLTLKFTDHLPDGPYLAQTSKSAGDIYLNLTDRKTGKLVWNEVKSVLEARAAKLLSVQAKAMPSHVAVKSAWTVRKVEYNGVEVFFEKNMMNVKDEETTFPVGPILFEHAGETYFELSSQNMGGLCCTGVKPSRISVWFSIERSESVTTGPGPGVLTRSLVNLVKILLPPFPPPLKSVQQAISKQGRVYWTDVKTVMEAFPTKVLSQQAKAMPGHVKMQGEWTVLKIEYKGGEVAFEKSLMNAKDGDMAVATFQQKITFDVKLYFCTIA
ncbi:hypothetical protein BKA69DRAFT_1128153 [Paraphysoderma sedebokerense]|nr:hypothetical protein BKA69DRAFT_1128153 [Paraphysoderma sedebokerense]